MGRIRVCIADITLSRSGYSLQAREQDNDMPCWFGSALRVGVRLSLLGGRYVAPSKQARYSVIPHRAHRDPAQSCNEPPRLPFKEIGS